MLSLQTVTHQHCLRNTNRVKFASLHVKSYSWNITTNSSSMRQELVFNAVGGLLLLLCGSMAVDFWRAVGLVPLSPEPRFWEKLLQSDLLSVVSTPIRHHHSWWRKSLSRSAPSATLAWHSAVSPSAADSSTYSMLCSPIASIRLNRFDSPK